MSQVQKYFYRLFDRKLISEIALPLLRPWVEGEASTKTDVKLNFSALAIEPSGSIVFENPRISLRVLFDGLNSLFILSPQPFVAVVDPLGEEVTVHPLVNLELDKNIQEFDLASKLVTWVLSHIPILWGTPAIHGAALSLQEKSILLLGDSGVGKSTLSQYLARDFGFTLHDDDTSCIGVDITDLILIPMGAAARLRQDAANELNVTGRALKGYAGEKIALEQKPERIVEKPAQLSAIFLLEPSEAFLPSRDSYLPTAVQLEPLKAIIQITPHIFLTSADARQREVQFQFAHALSRKPTFSLHFAHKTHSPQQVAAVINKILEA